ncbi:amino acid ABC transporter permease [Pseudoclavibacter sp. CFCC 11306]|uniref:amino acid ABC transporter permease n=1 Tax=Pseudoclavibacter sp. CFCC 11306 TaxID=1564493 RepID=UPI00130161B9|nr:amino acid ABC transporter permease [Pseudoclavibacter sp. CFCC 11306]KAB1659174.1 amino acid ABC transporter permease [Pseudoclavibacter sp. CFCC 11306]
MKFDWTYFWKALFSPSEAFLNGFYLTIGISVASMVCALVLGLVIALFGRARWRLLNWLAAGYVWLIRGTPLLVQLVIIYMGFAVAGIYTFQDTAFFGIQLKAAVQAAIVGMTIHEAAYISEIIRAGLGAVPPGQFEAAKTLGMSAPSAMRWIILPQALRTMVPPLGNIFNGLMKSTSVLSIIGVSEMFLVAQSISSATFKTFEIFIVAAIYYLLLTTVWTFVQNAIERALDHQIGLETRRNMIDMLFRRRGRGALREGEMREAV